MAGPNYDAFISYSHAKDKPIAAALQSAIQKLGKPWYKLRDLRVFRDDTSLAATPGLWPTIERALAGSRYIILLASPEAAQSVWVAKEVEYWLAHKSADTLLIGLTAGDMAWADGDFGSSGARPLPAPLKGRFANEPKWVDLTVFRDKAGDKRLTELAADFAAAVRGIPKEDLLSEELRQQRRVLRLAWGAAATMLLLGSVATALWFVAAAQRDRAERTLAASTNTANSLVIDLAQKFRETAGVRQEFVISVLGQARGLVDELAKTETISRELKQSRGNVLAELSSTLRSQGDVVRALKEADDAVAIFQELLKGDATHAGWLDGLAGSHDRRGDALAELQRRPEALAAYQQSLALHEKLLARGVKNARRNVAVAYDKLGDMAGADNRVDVASEWYRKGAVIRQQIVDGAGSDTDALRDLAVSQERVGGALFALGKPAEALPLFRASLATAQQLAEKNPDKTNFKHDLAVGHQKLGDLLQGLGESGEALEHYREDYGILAKLASADDRIDLKRAHLSSTQRYADALIKAGTSNDAVTLYRQAIETAKVASADKSLPDRQHELAIMHHKLGEALRLSGLIADAVAPYRTSLDIRIALARLDPARANWERELRENFQRLSDLLVKQKKPRDAFSLARERVQIVRALGLGGNLGLSQAVGSLAWYALCAGEAAEALTAADEAIALAPQSQLFMQGNRAHALMFTGSVDEARRIYLARRKEMFSPTVTWEKSVTNDFAEFRNLGLAHPLMAEIEATFATQTQ